MRFDPTTLEIYRALYTSVAEEMGIALRRTSFSPNIKERRDYSCAVFDSEGRVIAQGDHMPVHLGSMPMAVEAALREVHPGPGDVVALNDPFAGGTHLPDVTLVMGVWPTQRKGETEKRRKGEKRKGNGKTGKRRSGREARISISLSHPFSHSPTRPLSLSPTLPSQRPAFYVANRAHHADIGGATPGSMGMATDVYGEGIRIPPVRIVRNGEIDQDVMRLILNNVRGQEERRGDFQAQIGSLKTGSVRLLEILERRGIDEVLSYAHHLIAYSARMMRHTIASIPDGEYEAEDALDDDGKNDGPVVIRARVT